MAEPGSRSKGPPDVCGTGVIGVHIGDHGTEKPFPNFEAVPKGSRESHRGHRGEPTSTPLQEQQFEDSTEVEPKYPATEQACELIDNACNRDPYSDMLTLIVISGKIPSGDIIEQNRDIILAEIDGEENKRILDDAFAFLGSARLILCDPTFELLMAVIDEIPKRLNCEWYRRVTTYFVGHGAMGLFFLGNDSVYLVHDVIAKFNSLPIQHFHFFDSCRTMEKTGLNFPLIGDVAVIYATQPYQISFTGLGAGGSGSSDGVGVFTRRFAMLVKTHEGDFEQFARELGCQTIDELKELDSELDTGCCRPVLYSTNVKKINFKNDRDNAMKPRKPLVTYLHNGYVAQIAVHQPSSPVEHHLYAVKTHEVQIKTADDWVSVGDEIQATPGQTHIHLVSIPLNMLGCEARFRVLAKSGDKKCEIPSLPTVLQPPDNVRPVLEVSVQRKCNTNWLNGTWNHAQPPKDAPQVPQFRRYTMQTKLQNSKEEWKTLTSNQVKVYQENRTASIQPQKSGVYLFRVCATFEGVEGAVCSEGEEIEYSKPCCICTGCDIAIALILFFFALLGIIPFLLVLVPVVQTQCQLYGNVLVECANSSSILTRWCFSNWKLTECNPEGSAYNNLNAFVIPDDDNGYKTKEVEPDVVVNNKSCTFTSDKHYLLPYVFVQHSCSLRSPYYIENRYMVEGSTARVEVRFTGKYHTSALPFLLLVFDKYSSLESYVESGDMSNVSKKYHQTQSKQTISKPLVFLHTVNESAYQYFAFSTPVNTTLSITTKLVEWQYVKRDVHKKYQIGKSEAIVPISFSHGEKVLCNSSTVSYDRDLTHICATPERRYAPVFFGAAILVICALIATCYCVIKHRRKCTCCSQARARGGYAQLYQIH